MYKSVGYTGVGCHVVVTVTNRLWYAKHCNATLWSVAMTTIVSLNEVNTFLYYVRDVRYVYDWT